ncbi:hypothetical protein UlMin_031978 [Ulmus minor]
MGTVIMINRTLCINLISLTSFSFTDIEVATIIYVYACCSILKIVIFGLRIETKNSIVGVKGVCFVIFCEAVAIYGVIVAIILQTKLESVPVSQIYAPEPVRAGYAISASGIIVGFTNLVCRLCVGIIGSSCALSDAQNSVFCSILFSSYVSLKSTAFNLGL